MKPPSKISAQTLIKNAVGRCIESENDRLLLISFLKYLIPIARDRFSKNLKKNAFNFETYFTWYIGEVINTFNTQTRTITSPLLLPLWNEWSVKKNDF